MIQEWYLFEQVPHSISNRGQSFESTNVFEQAVDSGGDILHTPG